MRNIKSLCRQDIKEAVKESFQIAKPKYGLLMLVYVFTLSIFVAQVLIAQIKNPQAVLGWFILLFFVISPFVFGYMNFLQKMVKTKTAQLKDLIVGFQSKELYMRSIRLLPLTILFIILLSLVIGFALALVTKNNDAVFEFAKSYSLAFKALVSVITTFAFMPFILGLMVYVLYPMPYFRSLGFAFEATFKNFHWTFAFAVIMSLLNFLNQTIIYNIGFSRSVADNVNKIGINYILLPLGPFIIIWIYLLFIRIFSELNEVEIESIAEIKK